MGFETAEQKAEKEAAAAAAPPPAPPAEPVEAEPVEPELEEEAGPPALTVDVDPRELPEAVEAEQRLMRAIANARNLPDVVDESNKNEVATSIEELKNADKDAEAARKGITRQFDDAKTRVKAHFDELRSQASAAKEALSDALIKHEQQRQQEAEEKRQAELAEARKAQEEERKKAEEEQRRARTVLPPAPKAEPKGARSATGHKAALTEEWAYEIEDEEELPDEFKRWEPNRSKILEHVRAGEVIPGVRSFKKPKVRI